MVGVASAESRRTISNFSIASDSPDVSGARRSEEHTSELQSRQYLVCRLLLEKKKKNTNDRTHPHHTFTNFLVKTVLSHIDLRKDPYIMRLDNDVLITSWLATNDARLYSH